MLQRSHCNARTHTGNISSLLVAVVAVVVAIVVVVVASLAVV